MPSTGLCTEAEITTMVHASYADVRHDALPGPVSDEHVDDWDHHLAKLVDFWSSALRGTGRFSGTPTSKHAALPDLTPELFQRWLALFRETTIALPNRAMGEQAYMLAQRIARSLWYGYQLSRKPEAAPIDLPHD